MVFKDKYTTNDKIEADSKENSKVIVTNNTFALCELIEDVVKSLERSRING